MPARTRVSLRHALGLDPFIPALRQGWRAIRGDDHSPPGQWGLSSVRIFKPSIGWRAWLGRLPPRRIPIYNFFNRVPQPKDEGYSVRVTYARDFRGGRFTYDGHLGTDFAVPCGTHVLAPAPGQVLRVCNEMDRGGLKVCIDHGRGLFSTYNHLSRATVAPGQFVARGARIGLSGASGLEFVLFFPWVAPHVHFNAWLNGRPRDPFALDDEVSLWRTRNDPRPWDGASVPEDADFEPTPWSAEGVAAATAACVDPAVRALIDAKPTLAQRAAEVQCQRVYRPFLFTDHPPIQAETFAPRPCLDLMFDRADWDGVALPR